MFEIFKNEKDKKMLKTLLVIMIVLKILGFLFANYYAENDKIKAGKVYRNKKMLEQMNLPPVVKALGYHWDSIHYVNISKYWAQHLRSSGYIRNIALFYPFTIMLLAAIVRSNILAAVILSNLFSILTIIAFYAVCRLYISEEKSFSASVVLMVWPAFFVSGLTAYSEPMFLFFAILSWYYFEKEDFLLSAIFTGMCLCTRTSGMILIAVYFLCFTYRTFVESKKQKKIVAPPASALWYLIPVACAIAQLLITRHLVTHTGIRGGSFNGLVPKMDAFYAPLLSPLKQLQYFAKETNHGLDMYKYILPSLILGLGLKKYRPELTIYALVAMFSIMSLSDPSVIRAIPRHVLNAWPIFIIVGDFLEDRLFLTAFSTYWLLEGFRTLDFYFTVCYI